MRKKQPKSLDVPLIGGKQEQRFCICGDDSGHEYFIPVNKVEKFYAWVEATENGEYTALKGFDANRIDGRFTFTDPRCE